MPLSAITDHIKPGFPQTREGDNGITTDIEYSCTDAEFSAAAVEVGDDADPYPGNIKAIEKEPMENTAELTIRVSCEEVFESGEEGTGDLREISYEIEWVAVERSLFEHPQFRLGGGGTSELTALDVVEIGLWREEENPEHKAAFKFFDKQYNGLKELSTPAKLFATGLLMGLETWTDFAPVARKTSKYVNGPPPATSAGLKETPTGFPNLPTGYEWRKSADRSLRAGGQRKWDETEEWEGAKTILFDKTTIYWTGPA